MKNNVKFLAVALTAFGFGLALNSTALSSGSYNIAIIDLPKVVESSKQVNTFRAEQKRKLDDLGAFVNKARADIDAQKNPNNKKQLEEKYNKELVSKKVAIEKENIKKLKDIDKSIKSTIQAKAKANNYDLVISSSVVLYGGKDITNEVIKSVK
jgi:outer membrane protein